MVILIDVLLLYLLSKKIRNCIIDIGQSTNDIDRLESELVLEKERVVKMEKMIEDAKYLESVTDKSKYLIKIIRILELAAIVTVIIYVFRNLQ